MLVVSILHLSTILIFDFVIGPAVWYSFAFHFIILWCGEVMYYLINRIVGVMVSALASSAVDRGFEPRSGQTKDYKFGIC